MRRSPTGTSLASRPASSRAPRILPMSTLPRLPRLETGVPGLDRILGGGLHQGGLYLIQGSTGTGKTILSGQIAFHLARRKQRAVLVTLIAESHGKLLHHLSELDFFDEALLTDQVVLLSGYQKLLDEGLRGLLTFLAATLRDYRPVFLVLDGFSALRDHAEDRAAVARFLHELNMLVTTTRCTMLLLAHESGRRGAPEHALVDGLIELGTLHRRLRRGRTLEVHKMRASAPLNGTHLFRISSAGLAVFPRLEAIVTRELPTPGSCSRRMPFGIPRLDEILHGGLPEGSTTSLLGSPGAGKTLLGLQFLGAGLARGEQCLYCGFFESPDRIRAKSAAVGLDLSPGGDRGRLHVFWQPPLELFIDEIAMRLLSAVRSHKVQRLFIDGAEGFAHSALQPRRMSTFLTALSTQLRTLGTTTVLSEELPLFSETIDTGELLLSGVVENILLLRYVEIESELQRLISIIKMRDSAFDPGIRRFHISDRGLEVTSKFEAVEQALTGRARRIRNFRAGVEPARRPADAPD